MTEKPIKKVVIVGAGPSGLLLGVMLARAGIQVQLLDAGTKLDENPRAAHYSPSAAYELSRAGVLDDVEKEGFRPGAVCWRNLDREVLGGLNMNVPDMEYALVVLPLDKLGRVLLRHLLSYPNAEVRWAHNVKRIGQDENEAKVYAETSEGEKMFSGDYVVGCDGANSQVRRSLFGDWEYPGETLEHQIIASNVYYDFYKFGYWDSNFVIDPKNWYMAAKITPDGLWRVTYGDVWGLTPEEYLKRQPMRYEEILPGNPKPGDYKLVSASPYKLHQRCAKSFRVGRFLLAADAAHLCNPFGGLGLTGGMADIGSLYDSFMGIQNGLTDDSILDKYSELRINKWKEVINPMSRANFKKVIMEESPEDSEKFWQLCERVKNDEKFRREMAESSHQLLRTDVTPFFTKPVTKSNGVPSVVGNSEAKAAVGAEG